MPGPLIADPTPDWLKPENASVTDSALTKAMRMMAHVIGADNPSAQVFNWMTTELPGGEVQGGIAKAMEGLKGRVQNAIKAYHGSPHDFEQFSLSKIGTGEGAQAYGHGLYFAENPSVAEDYKRQLAGRAPQWASPEAAAKYDPFTLEAVKRELQKGQSPDDIMKMNAQYAKLAKEGRPTLMGDMHNALANKDISLGKMYEVAIHADPEDFLDYDRPIYQQGPAIREKVSKAMDALAAQKKSVAEYHELIGTPHGSAALKEAGIPGIKYLDQGSRMTAGVNKLGDKWFVKGSMTPHATQAAAEAAAEASGGVTRNYVVFDDKLIDIQKKYAALLAAGLSAEEAHRQATK